MDSVPNIYKRKEKIFPSAESRNIHKEINGKLENGINLIEKYTTNLKSIFPENIQILNPPMI